MVNTKRKLNIFLAGIVSVTSGVVAYFRAMPEADAVPCSNTNSANPCDINFNVNVVESLSVTITTPETWAKGDVNTFLRNKVNLTVSTSNSSGYTASMYSVDSTNLSDTASHTIPTLAASSTRSAFGSNHWGYSLGTANSVITTAETDAGNMSAIYAAMTTSTSAPAKIKETSTAVDAESTDIYFGAKADVTQAAGTYSGDVIISVVTGPVDSGNPITPTNPAVDSDDTVPGNNTATYTGEEKNMSVAYSGVNNSTGRGYSHDDDGSSENTKVKSTEIIEGNYTAPLGVTTTTTATNIVENNNALATGLAVTATVAAASGIIFFIAGKRDDDDDEEEQA